jgi:cation diffusion facilitator family transporter
VKQKTARLSVVSNTLLVVTKLAVGCAIGSVGIISEAIHSGIDLVAAGIAFLSIRKASEPADACHRFGHGKYEDFSGLIEAILIFVAAALIIREAAGTLISGNEELAMDAIGFGMAVMLLSAGVNWYVSARLMRAAKETESIALESDAWHLRTDVYTSLAMLAGLVAIRLTGLVVLDAVFALGVAVIIMKAAFDLTRRAFSDLTDHALPPEEEERIRQIICDHSSDVVDFHALRTRRAGSERFIDLHLVVSRADSLETAYDLVKHIESDIGLEFPRANVSIRVEPCPAECAHCPSICHSGKEEPDRRHGA